MIRSARCIHLAWAGGILGARSNNLARADVLWVPGPAIWVRRRSIARI